MRRALVALLLISLMPAPAAGASVATEPWPPATGAGTLFVHFGEEHWNDEDGLTLLPKIVEETARYRPALVTMSGDKGNDGTTDELSRWKQIMTPYDTSGIPYYAGVGNHDRDSFSSGGLPPPGPLDDYVEVFRDRPYPFGDTAAKADPELSPRERPAGDPEGAASHYFIDYANVRWVFIDNSCFAIDECDMFQEPSAQTREGEGQLAFLERVGREASAQGRLVFAVMHMPTRDPGDQSYRDPIAFNHVMSKGATDDNDQFERVAEAAGVDGVFLGHIKGQFLYRGRGDVPYYIDGGAGGELYTEGPVGTDHGYWHGFRLVRVDGGNVVTDTVPIFVPDSIRIEGAGSVRPGKRSLYQAFGRQPVFKDPAKVEALELRDPDPIRPVEGGGMGSVGGFVRDGGWAFVPVILLMLIGVMITPTALPRPRRRAVVTLCVVTGVGVVGTAAMSVAQQTEPTTTPLDSLPAPARIFTTSDPLVLAPVASANDDPRRDARTQTEDGLFEAQCPGAARVKVTSGFETSEKAITVPSRPVTRIVRRARLAKVRGLRAGRRRVVARVGLVQPAVLHVRVRRGKRVVRTLRRVCLRPGSGGLRVAWDGRVTRAGKLRPARPGRYRIELRVLSDRKPVKRSRSVRVLRKRR